MAADSQSDVRSVRRYKAQSGAHRQGAWLLDCFGIVGAIHRIYADETTS
jgi:hypothetical protein